MQCQCSYIALTPEEQLYIESKFDDCLCVNCLIFLQKAHLVLKGKQGNHK